MLLQNHAQIQHLRRLDRSLQREDGQHHIIIQPETGCNSTELTLIDRWVHQCRPQTMCGFVEADHAGNRSGSHNPNNEVNHTQLAALNQIGGQTFEVMLYRSGINYRAGR